MLSNLFHWSSSRDSSTSYDSQDRKKLKKKGARTRAEQLALLNGDARAGTPVAPICNDDSQILILPDRKRLTRLMMDTILDWSTCLEPIVS